MEQANWQASASADPCDRLIGVVVGLRRAVEVPHEPPRLDQVQERASLLREPGHDAHVAVPGEARITSDRCFQLQTTQRTST